LACLTGAAGGVVAITGNGLATGVAGLVLPLGALAALVSLTVAPALVFTVVAILLPLRPVAAGLAVLGNAPCPIVHANPVPTPKQANKPQNRCTDSHAITFLLLIGLTKM
jgi:hypothetical protein